MPTPPGVVTALWFVLSGESVPLASVGVVPAAPVGVVPVALVGAPAVVAALTPLGPAADDAEAFTPLGPMVVRSCARATLPIMIAPAVMNANRDDEFMANPFMARLRSTVQDAFHE